MDLLPTYEQQQIADGAAAYLAERLPARRLKAADASTAVVPKDVWRQMADLGWLGLGLAPELGGVGCGPSEEALLFREIGRVLGPPELLFAVVAAHAAAAGGEEALAAAIIRGEHRVSLAVPEPAAGDRGWRRLYGAADARHALSLDDAGAQIVDLAGLGCERRPCLDPSVEMRRVDVSSARLVCRTSDPAVGLRGVLLTAALQVGLAEAAVKMLVDYAKVRETFGRPIGAYQAVRHPCAEMAARAEQARAQLFLASIALADGAGDAALQVLSARVLAERAALQNADDNIQYHGGIGVTEEFDASHYLKRATVAPQWFGDRRGHLKRILDLRFNAGAHA